MIDFIKEYFDKRIQLVKLESIGVLANVSSGLVHAMLLLVIGLFTLLMFSLALGFWLSDLLESKAYGFAIVGGIYTFFFIIYFLFGESSVDRLVKDKMVKLALDVEEDNEETINASEN